MLRPLSTRAAALVLCSLPALAQLDLDKAGGAVPGSATFLVAAGPAGAPYVVVLSTVEQPSEPLPGVFLGVGLELAQLVLTTPGLIGFLDGAGTASASVPIPNVTALVGLTFSAQAVAGPSFDQVSDIVRVTPALPGTFAPTLSPAALPLVTAASARPDSTWQIYASGLTQRYDAELESFESLGIAPLVGLFTQATELADGRVLFTGGLGANGQPTAAAAVFDPADGSTLPLTLAAPRAGHGASRLGDGRVLVTGGLSSFDLANPLALFASLRNDTELFDPVLNAFAPGPAMLEPRALHTQTALDDGGALLAGGLSRIPIVDVPTVAFTAVRWIPAFGGFGLPSVMQSPRLMHAATKLDDGRVLLVGGITIDFATFLTTGNVADLKLGTRADGEVFTGGFFGGFATVPGSLSSGRALPGVAPLPGGGALVVGGLEVTLDLANPAATTFAVLSTADRLAGNAFGPTGALVGGARFAPFVQPLDDGTVLVLGGGPPAAEVYQP